MLGRCCTPSSIGQCLLPAQRLLCFCRFSPVGAVCTTSVMRAAIACASTPSACCCLMRWILVLAAPLQSFCVLLLLQLLPVCTQAPSCAQALPWRLVLNLHACCWVDLNGTWVRVPGRSNIRGSRAYTYMYVIIIRVQQLDGVLNVNGSAPFPLHVNSGLSSWERKQSSWMQDWWHRYNRG